MHDDHEHTHTHGLALTLASQALLMAVLDQDNQARRMIQLIHDRYGAPAVFDAMLLWTDTYAQMLGPSSAPVQLVFTHRGIPGFVSADDVPPPVAWAGRFISARVARDVDQTQALLQTLPDDPREQGDAVWTLLLNCALNLRDLTGQP